MTKTRRSLLAAAAAAGAAVALPSVGASPAQAAVCKPPSYPGNGYFTGVRAFGISCPGARKVVLAHYRCRTKNGRKGRCTSFNGWRASETRRAISTEYNARVVLRKGSRKIVYTYQQNT